MMVILKFIERFFEAAAWPMVPPRPYSPFHLLLTFLGISLASGLALVLSGRCRQHKKPGHSSVRHEDMNGPRRVLFSCGLLLAFLELYKQGFLFFVEYQGQYNWWYFPFQLCSIPMYLCLAVPFLPAAPSPALRVTATFLQDFGLLGGLLALAVPPGLMHPYWVMTLHGFLWHFILVFIGLYCAAGGLSDCTRRGYLHVLPLFFSCCLLALGIDTLAGPGVDADMFYISPYHPSSQPFFHQLSLRLGILPGILLYIAAMVLGGWVIHRITGKLKRSQ